LPCGNYTTDDAARSTNIEASHLAFCKGLWGYCVIFFLEKFFMKPCKSCTSPKTCQKMGKCRKRSSKRKSSGYKIPGY